MTTLALHDRLDAWEARGGFGECREYAAVSGLLQALDALEAALWALPSANNIPTIPGIDLPKACRMAEAALEIARFRLESAVESALTRLEGDFAPGPRSDEAYDAMVGA